MDAPLCACGCRRSVKRDKRRGRRWHTYASIACANKSLNKCRRPSALTIAGRERWRREQWQKRHARMLGILRDVAARRLSVDAACVGLVEMQYGAYRKGNQAGYRRALRDGKALHAVAC